MNDVGRIWAAACSQPACRGLSGLHPPKPAHRERGAAEGSQGAAELAAARMVSMSARDVRDRLGDRFRLLSGSRRRLERHQTLRHAVQWSYELLTADEQLVLEHASVFADGFDMAITHVCGGFDEYTVLDLLDSLVRKSLVTVDQIRGHARYGLLETIRQFAKDRLSENDDIGAVRDCHARYFADQVITHWGMWDGPGYDVAVDWVDVELANLRTGFRWAADRHDIDTAAAIAAHAAMLADSLQRYEPALWAEELLPAAIAADLRSLPRLYIAAKLSMVTRPVDEVIPYAQAAVTLEMDPRYESFGTGWGRMQEGMVLAYADQPLRMREIFDALATEPGLAGLVGSLRTPRDPPDGRQCDGCRSSRSRGQRCSRPRHGRRDAGSGLRPRQLPMDRHGVLGIRPRLHGDRSAPRPRRAPSRAPLHQRAPNSAPESTDRTSRGGARSGARRTRPGPRPVRRHHRFAPPVRQHPPNVPRARAASPS